MKKLLFLIIFIQFFYNITIADIKKYLGDPNPVDIVFDCIDPNDNLKIVMNYGFNKIEPIKTSVTNKNIIQLPGLGNGLGYTSFANAFFLVDFNKEKELRWASISDGMFAINLMQLAEKELGSSRNINIPLVGYIWDTTEDENKKVGSLLWNLYDAYEDGNDFHDIRKKLKELDDYIYLKLFPKYVNLDPAFQSVYNCNIGKYIPEN